MADVGTLFSLAAFSPALMEVTQVTTQDGWWHVDQNAALPARQGKVCVQGLVTYTAASAETGGLCLIPGSHRQHDDLCHRSPAARQKIDFVTIEYNDPVLSAGPGPILVRS